MSPVTVVYGAGGATGLECVKRLIDTNMMVRAVVRDPSKYTTTFPTNPKLEVVAGDVQDPSSIRESLKGADGVIFAASGKGYWSADSVDHIGVVNVAQAAKQAGVNRVVLVSSMLVTPKNWFHPIRLLLNNMRWGLMDAKFKGEEALRKSGVPYTIVRPGGLSNLSAGQSQFVVGQGDSMRGGGMISRGDVAALCVEALTNPKAKNVTFEVCSKPGLKSSFDECLKGIFTTLKPDA